MARKAAESAMHLHLFQSYALDRARRARRQRALFIPRLVLEAAKNPELIGRERDAAQQVAIRWADLESSGNLLEQRETSIDTQFLDQLFGEGLGYGLKTVSPDAFQLEHKYAVSGVGIADAALGDFPRVAAPAAVIELKDARTDLDRDRFNGRTAVQQCWDYLNALPDTPWGIVCNFRLIRLYHRSKGSLRYEEFALQELRDRARFNEFYAIFERGGLTPTTPGRKPRALLLLERTEQRQQQVGDDLYESYRIQRLRLIDYLMRHEKKTLDSAIAIAQKLLDRIIFIAFCEDRDLLPPKCLERAHDAIPPFAKVRNPRWHNFLALFDAVDKGSAAEPPIERYNGGLFADDPEIDALELDDIPWATAFKGFGNYDFSEEVNVEVLGQLFERSITELEKLRVGGLFALKAGIDGARGNGGPRPRPAPGGARRRAPIDDAPPSKMPKSAQRKRFGIYYTPPAFTGLLVERTVDAYVRERFAALAAEHELKPVARESVESTRLRSYWRACLDALQSVTVCDPACGCGAFLIRAYDALDAHYTFVVHGLAGAGENTDTVRAIEDSIPDLILARNLYGVDLSHEGVEITQLALWIRSARKGRTLADLSGHIKQGNSLVSDPAVDPRAMDWRTAFPSIFGEGGPGGFRCVIGNPPWERVKVQDREFFSLTDPTTAEAVNAADRKKRIAAMPHENPDLHSRYVEARDRAQRMLDYARGSSEYPLTGKGDVNLYMLFAELAGRLVAPDGLVGLLVPSGIATDDTTKEFFSELMDNKRLVSLYDFENKQAHFEDVHRSFKFTALVFGGASRQTEQADFVFFAHSVEETAASNKHRHIALTAADMKLLNPNTRTCPIFRTRRDADLTRSIYRRVPILIDENRRQGGNPWGITFFTMFHQTNDAGHFKEAKVWEKRGYRLEGNVYVKGNKRALPLYEAKMVQAFDHRAASVVVDKDNWVRQGQKTETYDTQYQNPEYAVMPRWWVAEDAVDAAVQGRPGNKRWWMGFKDITSPTNERTMISSFIPRSAVTNKFVLLLSDIEPRRQGCLLGNLNSHVLDYLTRQKIGGITLNFFIVEQLPALLPDTYDAKCPWATRETLEHWISERVLKLSCTAEDMLPLARACDFKGSRGDGVHIWKEPERAELRAELDAAFFILYGIERPDVEYILSTFTSTGLIPRDERRADAPAWERHSPGEMILDAYDRMTGLQSQR
ncbi:MAG: DNA methyltransferase [Phycisphaerae bacterium]